MVLDPVFNAPLAVQIHVFAVVPAAVLGGLMLMARKGTRIHKLLGRVWVSLMAVTAISSFFIHTFRLVGPFSPIHLLSIITLVACVVIIRSARAGQFAIHRRAVLSLYWGGIGIAGAFAMVPGRIMNQVMLGGATVIGWPLAIVTAAICAAVLTRVYRSAGGPAQIGR